MADNDEHVETLDIVASGVEIRRASEWFTTVLQERDVPDAQVESLELALHEVLANVLDHGGSSAHAEPIRIRIEVRETAQTGEARVTVTDAGMPFDPTSAPARAPAKTLAEGQSGGMGLPLIRRCSELMSYRREGGCNHFMFGARWPKL